MLYALGVERARRFCETNGIVAPTFNAVDYRWSVGSCAYYRPDEGIRLCLPLCGRPAPSAMSRNWSWPGSVVDREPYGVVCHELGHHVDWLTGERKGRYGSDFSIQLEKEAREKGLTSYAGENAWEWFAEAFRLFITNHNLLYRVRPRTWELLVARWTPVSRDDWREELGPNVPDRVVQSLERKFK